MKTVYKYLPIYNAYILLKCKRSLNQAGKTYKIHFFLFFNIYRFTKEKIKVTLGEYSFDQDDETLVQEKIGIRNMKNHEKYNDKTFENDIALIRLDRKVQFSKSVYPICLPPRGTDFTDTRAFVVGKLCPGTKMISTLFGKIISISPVLTKKDTNTFIF